MANATTEATSYNRFNDYELTKLEIVPNRGSDPVNLLLQFVEITIYESIFDTKLVGDIVISDGLNFSETIPLVGDEVVNIEFKTKGAPESVNIVGRVFAVPGKGRGSNEKMEVSKIRFVTDIQYKDHLIRISQAKRGTAASIVKDLFQVSFGKPIYEIDQTDTNMCKYVFPYWSPLTCINWIAQRTFSPGGSKFEQPSCFVFYEDIDGFHFVDILNRVAQKSSFKFRIETNNPSNQTDVNRYMQRVQEYSISSYFDRLMELNTGMYTGTLYTHDITTKKFEAFDFDYRDAFAGSKHLNEHPLMSKYNTGIYNSKNSFRNIVPIQTSRMGVGDSIDKPQDYFSDRASVLRQFNTIKMTVMVPGNSSLRLLDVVDVEIPKIGYQESTQKDWMDGFLSGRYFIVSAKHQINSKTGYTTTFELAKDSLMKAIPDKVDPKNRDIV
jgi:hypothetical protein